MENYVPRLKKRYEEEIVPALMKRFGYKNKLQVPKLTKISLNIGVGRAKEDERLLQAAANDLTLIAGQKAVVTRARKAISNFKIRAGDPVGVRVTIRGNRMWEFLDRLVSLALPRVRDFNGLPTRSFDGRGNYSLGIKEQIIFPEIDYDKVDRIRGLDINITTSARTDEEAYELLLALGMPFKNSKNKK